MSAPFTLQIHPDAAKNFNEKAESLIPLVSSAPVAGDQGIGFRPDIHCDTQIGEKDIIGQVQVGLVDYRGREVGKFFDYNGKTVGLFAEAFKDLETLAIRLQQKNTVRPHLSVQCIIGSGFEWVKQRYLGETNESFTSFVLRECATLVRELEIWLPLSKVYLQTEVTIGKIKFKPVSREMLGQYIEQMQKNLRQERLAAAQVAFNRTRSEYQGCAAATITVIAEPSRAREVAIEEAGYSIAALRFFHPANMTPYVRCCCTLAGAQNVSTTSTFTVASGAIQQWQDSISPNVDSIWALSGQEIGGIRCAGLDAMSELLTKDNRSKFEDELLDAILIYTRNSLLDDAASRLIYILAAVESILLRDNNEPIQKNIAERLAFLVGTTVDERISVRDTVVCVYGARSAFLHHGRTLGEMETLELFMKYVWRAFFSLIQDRDKFQTKQQLIEALERRKME